MCCFFQSKWDNLICDIEIAKHACRYSTNETEENLLAKWELAIDEAYEYNKSERSNTASDLSRFCKRSSYLAEEIQLFSKANEAFNTREIAKLKRKYGKY